jgi:hypothetical protein
MAAEKPWADLPDVLRIGEFVTLFMTPRIRAGLIDLDLELLFFPFRGLRRGLLLLRLAAI